MFAAPALLWGEPATKKTTDFERDIFPIFAQRCFACHGPDEAEGQLRLDAKSLAFQGGVSGRLIIAGQGEKSLLYRRVAEAGEHEQMPLDDDALTDKEIALIARWIDEGANWPDGVGAQNAALKQHWAYVPPIRPQPPAVPGDSSPNAIDAFVAAKLAEKGLHFSPTAPLPILVRRVYLDLTGLPPSVDEVDYWVEQLRPETKGERNRDDINESALARLVDSLLASPRYGERWTRRWLDLARYADSNGYQADQYREVWPYRDWVINAINNDMPFDQFTIEQIAGDLLPNATTSQKIATGFNRLTTCNVEAGVDPEENRTNQVIDRVNTTATVWLGSTLECAQCHNHKYDPLSQRDYYQFFAYFNNTPLEVEGDGVTYNFTGPKMELPLSEEKLAKQRDIRNQLVIEKRRLAKITTQRKAEFSEWLANVAVEQVGEPDWQVLEISQFASSGGSSHEILADGSVLVKGERPDKDNYTVTVQCATEGVTAFRLETLTHESLPGNGPGRHDPERPNFVVYEMTVDSNIGDEVASVELSSATADFSQDRWPVSALIDGKPETGWAINPQFGKDHVAVIRTSQPLKGSNNSTLTFRFDQHYGGCRTIGRLRLSATSSKLRAQKLPAAIAKLVALPAKKRTKKQLVQLETYFLELDDEYEKVQKQIKTLESQLAAVKPTTTLVMVEGKPRKTHIFKRGDFLNLGDAIQPATPQRLTFGERSSDPSRLGLANWLASEQNPLTARVAVNRWWGEFFGVGLVRTQEDFGTQGERPTHPQLLDWLATELMTNGWSRKAIHRQIVLSRVYRQTSRVAIEDIERDPNNRWLSRGARFRMPAEMIRDNALAIAGVITHKVGGPPVFPPQPPNVWRHVGRNAPKYETDVDEDRFRRGLYVFWRRSAPYPSFTNFDAPDRAACTPERPRTNTPLQALTLLNDPVFVEAARELAVRVLNEKPDDSAKDQISYAMRLAIARQPTEFELSHLLTVYERELTAGLKSSPAAKAKADALFFVATIILNLDETISKS